jgi:uncharacterized protein (TIGR02118 family)
LRKEEDMVKVLVLFKRKSGMTLEECSRYWYEKHAPFAAKIIPKDVNDGIKKYIQNPAISLPGGGDQPFDGVVELHFNNLESAKKFNDWYFSNSGKALQDDERNFMDRDKMIILLTEERVMV